MKINELSKRTGLSAPAIRFYEEQGLLDSRYVQRNANNYRDYCEESVEYLLLIKEVQAAGFTLAEFKELDDACNAEDAEFKQRAVIYLQKKIESIHSKIIELQHIEVYLSGKLAEIKTD